MLNDLPSLHQTIVNAGFHMKKNLGQHFLLDENLCAYLAQYAYDVQGCNIYEVGPGVGGLTRVLLAKNIKQLIAIDRDKRAMLLLKDLKIASDKCFGEYKFTLLEGNALHYQLSNLPFHHPDDKLWIIANLPYNIATELLISWLYQANILHGMLLMFQKEVAQRICAQPQQKNYGRLSIITQSIMDCHQVADIDKDKFTPSPKVDSALLLCTPKQEFINHTEEYLALLNPLSNITGIFFNQRRKMIRKLMDKLFQDNVDDIYKKYNLYPQMRPEDITVNQYIHLARCFGCG